VTGAHDDPPGTTEPGGPAVEMADRFGRGGRPEPGQAAAPDPLVADPAAAFDPLAPSDNLRRRQLVSRMVSASQTAAALLAIGVLGAVVYSVVSRAWSVLSFHFLTHDLPRPGLTTPGGGIAPAIVGTAELVAIATAIALPVGILIALYQTEFAGRRSKPAIRLALDLLNGLPTIIVGLFVFGLLVVGHHQSGFAGGFALSIVMLPLIARATQEVLLLVPPSLREAADALGVSHWRTVRGVVLPAARGGILTATVLAVARAAGETAPLILVCSLFANTLSTNPFGQLALPNIPVYIFTASESADPYGFARAWGAAFVLLSFILLANLGARALSRSRSSSSL
jgi:phosphate transport system permease protein